MKTAIVLAHQTKNGVFQPNAFSQLTAQIPDTWDEWKQQCMNDGFPLLNGGRRGGGVCQVICIYRIWK